MSLIFGSVCVCFRFRDSALVVLPRVGLSEQLEWFVEQRRFQRLCVAFVREQPEQRVQPELQLGQRESAEQQQPCERV